MVGNYEKSPWLTKASPGLLYGFLMLEEHQVVNYFFFLRATFFFFLAVFFLAAFFLVVFFLAAFFLVVFFLATFFLAAFFFVVFFLAAFFLVFFLATFFLAFLATFFLVAFLATFFLAVFFLATFFFFLATIILLKRVAGMNPPNTVCSASRFPVAPLSRSSAATPDDDHSLALPLMIDLSKSNSHHLLLSHTEDWLCLLVDQSSVALLRNCKHY